jgi:murein hydrolase activator
MLEQLKYTTIKTLTILCVLCFSRSLLAQTSRQELERKKKENIEKIAEIKKILEKTTNNKEANLGQLRAINKQVKVKEQQIDLINDDLGAIANEIKILTIEYNQKEAEFKNLKAEYERSIYNSAKAMQNFSTLGFLFSSSSFNEFFLRYNYLRQIAKERQAKALAIKAALKDLQNKQTVLNTKQKEKGKVLNNRLAESKDLAQVKDKQQKVTNELVKQEEKLKKQLAERKRAVAQVERLISGMIEREISKSKARESAITEKATAKTGETASKTSKKGKEAPPDNLESASIKMNSSEASLSAGFAAARNRLPWPVRSGFISEGFGSHAHEVLKGVTVPNDGIEIQTNAGEAVRSVYEGTVMVVDNSIVGMGTVVAIQHGNFFTIYGKLGSTSVNVGDKVAARQNIGTVMDGPDGSNELQFQIWKNTQRQNPEKWLINR